MNLVPPNYTKQAKKNFQRELEEIKKDSFQEGFFVGSFVGFGLVLLCFALYLVI